MTSDGVLVNLIDLDADVATGRYRGCGGVARVLPGEDHVICGEGLAIMPSDILPEPPYH